MSKENRCIDTYTIYYFKITMLMVVVMDDEDSIVEISADEIVVMMTAVVVELIKVAVENSVSSSVVTT
jgi:hypothetical protein